MQSNSLGKKLGSIAIASFATFAMTGVSADVIDFKAMAEPSGTHGESIWDTFVYTGTGYTMNVTATKDGSAAYPYLDAGNAGLGVCGSIRAGKEGLLNTSTNSGTNLCNPSSDDNTTVGEILVFSFTSDVMINNIWLNNNHDPDKSLFNDIVDINGNPHQFTTNLGGPADYAVDNSYFVSAGSIFSIGFHGPDEFSGGDQFYVSAMDITAAVPEPESLLLLSLGILGLGLGGKRRKQ